MSTTAVPAIFSLHPSYHRPTPPSTPHYYSPNLRFSFSPSNSTPKLDARLKIFHKAAISSKRHHWVPSCCSGSSEVSPEESSINLQLPRRSLLVQFTCDACGERTKRLINRLAYERGTVFVQCAGCLQHHKLVDNLGLVVEYDFRNDTDEV